MAAAGVRKLLPLLAVASVVAGDDPELRALFERTRPSDEDEERAKRWNEDREREKRIAEDRQLRELVRNALEGIYGRGVKEASLAIIHEGRSTVHLQRIRKLVSEWRRAGRAKKRETKAKTKARKR